MTPLSLIAWSFIECLLLLFILCMFSSRYSLLAYFLSFATCPELELPHLVLKEDIWELNLDFN